MDDICAVTFRAGWYQTIEYITNPTVTEVRARMKIIRLYWSLQPFCLLKSLLISKDHAVDLDWSHTKNYMNEMRLQPFKYRIF